ncbi:MAG: glycosyltransferase family 1 protein [Methylocystis sp.]
MSQMTISPASKRPVVYDVSRLVTRALNPNPNGIDRVDFALARHFLAQDGGANSALFCSLLGPRVAPAALAAQAIDEIESCWNEFIEPDTDPSFSRLIAAFDAHPDANAPRIARSRFDRANQSWRDMRRWALNPGAPLSEIPHGAAYVNASQFLLDKPWFTNWLAARTDVKPVFFVHDLLTIDNPEFFWRDEAKKGPRRLRAIVRLGAGVIVASHALERRLRAFAASQGRAELPIGVARLPVAPVFAQPAEPDPRLRDKNYFVVCGTIEPRKNHMTLLNVWRRLAERLGPATPKLFVVGKRGWLNENVTDLMSRSPALRASVIEASGLSTPALRRLLAGARALLMPSFAEGFGLPVAEALAAKVPVIASNLEVFQEFGGDAPVYLDPLDGLGWLSAVEAFAAPESPARAQALARIQRMGGSESGDFFAAVDEFIAGL